MKKVTFLLILLATLAFACNQKPASKSDEPKAANVEIVYHVEGMTCDHCEMSIQKGVNALDGISLVEANYEDSTTHVVFDPSKTDSTQIAAAIEKRGYKVAK